VVDGIIHLDLADFSQIIPNASTSCGSAGLLAQLDNTLLQFDGIDATRYSFDGDEAAFYQWLQRDVPGASTQPRVTYDEEVPANYRVVGVAAADRLNIRSGPGTRHGIIGAFAHDAIDIDATGRIARVDGALWREVKVPGATVGWVAARYLEQM
jgi:hypothetical protein